MMLQGKSQVGLYLSPGKDARLPHHPCLAEGTAIEVAAAWGIDPLFMLVGSQTFRRISRSTISRVESRGSPYRSVRGTTTDLLLRPTRTRDRRHHPAELDQGRRAVRRIHGLLRKAGKPAAHWSKVTAVHYRSSRFSPMP